MNLYFSFEFFIILVVGIHVLCSNSSVYYIFYLFKTFNFILLKKTPGPMIGLGNLDANLEGYFMYLFF